jgi:hypothetical protein
MSPPLPQNQSQVQIQPPPYQNNQPHQNDSLLSNISTYGGITVLLLTMAKTYADYQLKAAIEERSLKSKDDSQSLELKGRAIESVFSQQEEAYKLQKELLDKLINKDLEQAQLNSSQIIEILANAVKSIDENGKLLEKNSIELSEIKQRLNQLVDLADEIISVLKSKG